MRNLTILLLLLIISTPVYSGVGITVGGTAIIKEGGTLTRNILITDDVDTGSNGWTYSVSVDSVEVDTGSITAGSSNFNISHTFPDGPTTSLVELQVTDFGADIATGSFYVIVQNVPPVSTITGNDTVEANSSYSIVLATADPGDDTISSRTIEWGDGTSNNILTHTYTTAGTYRIRVWLADEDGSAWMSGHKKVIVTGE
jgi:hypothetical protein